MTRSFGGSLLCAAALLGFSSVPVSAGVIYGLSSATPGAVYTIDASTGAATLVVSLTGNDNTSIVGLEFLNGTLYATDVFATDSYRFGTIDLVTGAFTPINDQGGSANWWSLAADPSAGLFYAVDFNNGNNLVSVTPGGVITGIGATGVDIAGLAFDALNSILYGVGNGDLYTIDVTTGAATLIGATGLAFGADAGLAYDPDTATLFLNGGSFDALYTVNTATGLATLIGPNAEAPGLLIDGLAVLPNATGEVPEPGSLLLAAIGGALLVLKRRRQSSSI